MGYSTPYERDCYLGVALESQTTNLPLVEAACGKKTPPLRVGSLNKSLNKADYFLGEAWFWGRECPPGNSHDISEMPWQPLGPQD